MATATAEARNVPAATDDGHKHKKNALSDGQGRLAWLLLAPDPDRHHRGRWNSGAHVHPGVVLPDQHRRRSHHRHGGGWREVRRSSTTSPTIFSGSNQVDGSWGRWTGSGMRSSTPP